MKMALHPFSLAAGLMILVAAGAARGEVVPRWEQENRPCRILAIGNSFSAQVEDAFPAAAKAIGKQIDFLHCKVGASTLQNHSDNLDTLGYYTMVVRFTTPAGSSGNPFGTAKGNATAANWSTTKLLQEIDWDIVTLQQRSITSSDVNSYEPYLGILVAKIRELCPTAKIYFHQTWTFDRYGPASWGKEWGGDIAKRDAFYDGINTAVSTMVAKHSLDGVIPVGYATQLFRYRKPVISQADDFCSNDHQHFNGSTLKYYEPSAIGKYLQSLVFAGTLLGEVPTCEQLVSQSPDAELARECAVAACAATDYSNYGQGTYNFSWSVKFKNGDAEISSLSVTNGAAATVPNTSELTGPSGKVFSGWSGEKTKRVANNVTTEQVQYTSAQVSTDPVYDDIVWTAVWGTTEDEPAVEPGGDEPGGDEPGGGDEPEPAEGQTILSTTPTDYGYTRQVQVGADVYTVKAYTNTRSEGWELTIPNGVTSIDYLVVGGGGSGGNRYGGGGGAGGMIEGTVSNEANNYTIFVGKGGSAPLTGTNGRGESGDASILRSGSSVVITANGGGGGACTSTKALNGGSGGGGSYSANTAGTAEAGSYVGEGVTGTGYANAGGSGSQDNSVLGSGGGGGGAGGSGADSSTDQTVSGKGGSGKLSTITGESICYAGGGGAAFYKLTTGAEGGSGGGGKGGGGASGASAATDGTSGTGGGGGGSGVNTLAAGAGGSGIVVVRYLDPNATVSLTDATVELFPAAAEYTVSAQSFSLGSLTLANGTFIHANTLTKGTDYTISPESVGPNCGTYTVTVTGQGRYSDSATTTFEIYMATPTLSGSVVQPGWTQGQTPPAPENTLSTTYGTVVVCYYTDDACTQAFTPSAATEPGTYYVRGEVDASDNWYKAVTDPEPFTVSAATPGPDEPTPTPDGVTTNAMANDWGYEIHGLGASGNEVALVYTNTAPTTTMTWTVPSGVTQIDYLVVGGGGSGGCGENNSQAGGGGGAGGVMTNTQPYAVVGGDRVAVSVGEGGTGVSTKSKGVNGGKSTLTIGTNDSIEIEALGGGYGGTVSVAGGGGDDVACGGGGGSGNPSTYDRDGGKGTCYKGGNGRSNKGGGGAGAGGDGVDGNQGGTGGIGVAVNIFGEPMRIAGGGGGSLSRGSISSGPDGGGSGGWKDQYGGYGATSGTTWGAGGGATAGASHGTSGSGHQGVVVIRYAEPTETPITDAVVTFDPESYTYAAEDLAKPAVTVTVGGVTLDPSSDYSVSWNPSTLRYANDYTATITAKGSSYTGEKTAKFYVDAAEITAVQLVSSSATYDGQSHTPVVANVKANGKTLTLNQDDGCKWTVVYRRNGVETDDFTSAGAITVEVTGNTSLRGTASATFTIVGATPEPDPDWGWSNRVTIAGTDYWVLAFTNTTTTHTWTVPTGVMQIDYLVVGGGGAGGKGSTNFGAGGGGGGAAREGTLTLGASGDAMTATISVGKGGVAKSVTSSPGGNGGDSSLELGENNISVEGGGGGGGGANTSNGSNGADGGCGGGCTHGFNPGEGTSYGGAGGEGNNTAVGGDSTRRFGGGGGGAKPENGTSPVKSSETAGKGGAGLESGITGSRLCYGGGGGGAAAGASYYGGSGGEGGGGRGNGMDGVGALKDAENGLDGFGGGGGGAFGSYAAGNGGSGVVIIRYAVGESKVVVPVPDAVSKPYTGEMQLSGIGETSYYTVSDPENAVNVGTYSVTLTLKEPNRYRFANGAEGSTTVDFSITRAENYWIANPQLSPTYWYVGDTVALASGEAKFGEATKTVTWYDKSGNVVGIRAEDMPTTVGEYTLKIAVPADVTPGNWSGIEYAIGFIIYEPLGVTQVGVPVLPDKEYTGATQTADIPDSPLWTVTANAGGVDANTYTATLQLKDKTKYTWLKADGTTTTDDQTISWHITKAKNRWTTEPKVYLTSDTTKAAIFSCAVNTPVSIANGTPRFGTVTKDGNITVTAVGTYLLKFTVAGDGNYEGLTYELAFQVGPTSPGTEGTDTVTYQWARNASGLWTIPDMWTGAESDVGYPYCTTAGRAIAKFDSLSKELSGSTTDYPVEVHFSEHLPLGGLVTTADAASDITINGHRFESDDVANTIHYRHFGFNGRGTGTALSSLTVGNTRLTLMDAQYDFSYADSSIESGSTLRLFNSKHEKRSTVNPADSAFGSFEFRINKKLTLAGTARLESDDYTSYVGTLVGDGAWTMALRNRSVMRLASFRHSTTTTTYSDKGWRMNIDNSLVIAKNNLALGCGTSDSYCDDPQISVQGEHGELYATDNLRLGSDASLARPLTVNITYPGKPFSWGSFVWDYTAVNAADLKIGAPIGAGKSLTVGSNVKFVIDLTTWAAAVTNLVTVPICCANVSRDAAAYYLNVPGASGGMLTDNGALQNWYTNNFTVVGVDKAAWELRYDEASRALQLRRKGAWSYDDDLAGFKWVERVSGRWADNSRWDLGRVPNSAKNYARFLGTASYPGYTLEQQIVADLESQNWEIQLLDLSESINLLIQNGGLTVNDNDTGSQSIKIRPGTTLKFDDVRLTQKNQTVKFEFLGGANETLELANTTLIAAKGGWCIQTDAYGGNQANSLVYVHDGSYATFQYLGMTGSNGRFLAEDSNVTLGGLEAQNLTIEALGASTVLKVNAWQGQSYNQPYRWDLTQHWLAADGATITLPQGTDDAKIFPNQRNTDGVVNRGKMANQLFVASNGVINASTFYLSDAKYNVKGSTTSPFSSKEANAFDPTQCSGNALRIYGKDGAFRSSGSVYLGYNGTQAGDPELTFGLPSQAWKKAPLSAANALEMRSNLQVTIDASAVKVATKVPIARAATLTLAEAIYSETAPGVGALGANVTVTGTQYGKSDFTFSTETEGGVTTLYLTVPGIVKTLVDPPEIPSKEWTGEKQTSELEDTEEFTVVKDEGGVNAGSYDVVVRLADPNTMMWNDELGDTPERTVPFQITKAQNVWTIQPRIDPPYWNVGGSGTLTAGVPRYGAEQMTVTYSGDWSIENMPTAVGGYSVRYSVPEAQNYSALSEAVTFYIYPTGVTPTGDPDAQGYVYTWRFNDTGYWTVTNNWERQAGATFGYPSAFPTVEPPVYATARFSYQYYDHPVTVNASGDITTGSILYDQGARGTTLNFAGHVLTLQNGVEIRNSAENVLAGGTFNVKGVRFASNNGILVADAGATVNVTSFAFADAAGSATTKATLWAREGGAFAYTGNLSLGTSASTGEGLTLALDGGNLTVDGTLAIGTAAYDASASPTVAITFPEGGFATAPIRTTGEGKGVTVQPGIKFTLDVTKLEAGETLYKIIESAGTMTLTDATLATLKENATFKVKTGAKAELVKDGNVLGVKLTNLGLTLMLTPSEGLCDGRPWRDRFAKTVTDSDGTLVTEQVTFEYRIAGGEWKSDLTDSEWTNPGVIDVRATVEGYANKPTAKFTIKSRGLILFFGPAN